MKESPTSFQEFPEQYYALFQNKEQVVSLESTQSTQNNKFSFLFLDPVQVLQIYQVSELEDLFASIAACLQQGYYLAGYFAYECGYHIQKLGLSDSCQEKQPLAWFGVYRHTMIYDHRQGAFQDWPDGVGVYPLPEISQENLTHQISDLAFNLDEASYAANIERIKEYIRAGDVYQINYTGRYTFSFEGSSLSLYRALKQKQSVSYSAYIRAAGQEILCFSPELFFHLQGQHIVARPMKGTAPRGRTNQEDRQIAEWLARDAKNRAENVMIVDLLRNDLGRFCQPGSVTVPDLFTIERYATLFQMTSTIEGRLKANVDLFYLFQSLFPCGSITGAPKIRAMEIIKELEASPRGIYTGSVGYFAPPQRNQPASALFNVAIRTIVLKNGHGEMGVGSGITFDSRASDEYAECAIKAYFLTSKTPDFAILEAILWDCGYQRLERHLRRMADSAIYFGYPYNAAHIHQVLAQMSGNLVPGQRYKVRLLLPRTGHCVGEAILLPQQEPASNLLIGLAKARTDSQNRMYYHKTTDRTLYDRASHFAQAHGYADLIFLNEKGEVTEGATNNVFIERDGLLLTPPVSCGLLGGIFRQWLLETDPRTREAELSLDDLLTAEQIYLGNAIRGLRHVRLREPSASDPLLMEF